MNRPHLLLVLPLLLTGCFIYPDDNPCATEDYGAADPISVPELRDPETGTCQAFGGGGGGGGGGGCGDEWGGTDREQAPGADIDWALCYQQCEGLDEATCLGTSACRAAYIEQSGDQTFYECWGTAPSGPIQGGGCEGLDAYACSLHDDCSPVHGAWEAPGQDGGFTNGIAGFLHCTDENALQGCYGDAQCDDGTHCNADTVCLPSPDCTSGGSGEMDPIPCDSACYGFCVPDVMPNPGSCTGEALCPQAAPACPVDTVPGILDFCWSGYCIPVDACQSVAECPGLGESACVSRSDCEAIYEGIDCTCTGDTCSCADWLFETCEAGGEMMPANP